MTTYRKFVGGDRRVTTLGDYRVTERTIPPLILREAPRYTLDLCTGFVRVGTASAFELTAIVRYLAAGEWVLTAPLAGLETADVNAVDSIILWDESEPASIVFAGIVRAVAGVPGGVERQVSESADSVTYTGVDVFGVLGQRSVWPTPSTVAPWADSHDERTGRGSTVAAGYIEANIGSTAIAARSIPTVTVLDTGAGTSSTWSGRLQPLDQFVGRVCRESGVSCLAHMPTPGALRYTLRSPTDRSDQIVITDQGDLEEMSLLSTPTAGSHITGAGQGELTSRSFAAADDGSTGLDRVEAIYENTNISTSAGLQNATNTQLALSAADTSVAGVVSEAAAQTIRYIDDYDVGDWLGVELEGVRYRSQVEAVRIEINAERESVRPVLGRSSPNAAVRVLRDIADLQERFDSQIA